MATEIGKIGDHDVVQSEMMGEMCLVVDSDDNVIGADTKLICHKDKGIRHRAFSVLIFDSLGRLLVQKRSSEKITFPGVWANSCCSHPLDVESENDGANGVENAAKRKLDQELGITSEITDNWSFNHIGRMEYSCRWNEDWIEREIDHIMVVIADTEVNHNENEISDVLWADASEIARMMEGSGDWAEEVIAPWFRLIWEKFAVPSDCDPNIMASAINEDIIYCGEVNMSGDSVAPGQSLLDALSDHRERVEEEIMVSLGKMEQKNLHGAMTHLFKGGGKRLRAILPRLVGDAGFWMLDFGC